MTTKQSILNLAADFIANPDDDERYDKLLRAATAAGWHRPIYITASVPSDAVPIELRSGEGKGK